MIFEKIRERLQELKTFKLNMADAMCELMKKDKLDNYISREEAIDIINQVEAEYNNRWISAEILPEECVDVLVWFEYFRYGDCNSLYQTYGMSYATDGRWSHFVNGSSGWHQLRIIAWQPLPDPYIPKAEPEWQDRVMNHFTKGE